MSQDQLTKIAGTLDQIVNVVVNTREDVKEVKSTLKEQGEKIDMLQTNQDWMISVLTRIDQERIMGSQTIKQVKEEMEDLKKRVQKLELTHA